MKFFIVSSYNLLFLGETLLYNRQKRLYLEVLMKIIGIVAEYNPFHNGHLYQINHVKQTLKADAVVVVMSGNFAQRGIPCITDKYTRTRMALLNGADLVLELPVPFATSSAQYFAEASIGILHHSKSIHTLCFGSESIAQSTLEAIASVLLHEPSDYKAQLQSHLSNGHSYPRARELALVHYFKDDTLHHLLQQPNVILGIAYIQALMKYKSTITCAPLKRIVSGYHDLNLDQTIASASAIRHAFNQGAGTTTKKALPDSSYALLESSAHCFENFDCFSDLFSYRHIFSTKEDFYALWDVPQTLCHSIITAAQKTTSLQEIINSCTSKTYSRATVQRAVLRFLLNIQEDKIAPYKAMDWTPYIRVLGCHPHSRHVLSHLCQNSDVPVITSLSKHYPKLNPLQKQLMDYELQATKLYALITRQHHLATTDFTHNIFPFDLQ